MAISFPRQPSLPQRDCHPRIKCGVAVTDLQKLGTREPDTLLLLKNPRRNILPIAFILFIPVKSAVHCCQFQFRRHR